MFSKFRYALAQLDLEEKILCVGSLVALFGVALPWLGGEWLGGERVTYSGVSFFTSFLGIAIVGLHAAILFVTFSPLMGGPIPIRRKDQDMFRFFCALQAMILTIAALSVLAKVTFEFSRVEIRFGVYVSLIGSLATSLYGFLKVQEGKRKEAREFFHHSAEDNPEPLDRFATSGTGQRPEQKSTPVPHDNVEQIKQDILKEHPIFHNV